MNPIIKKQLEACRVSMVPEISEETTLIHIPKGSMVNVSPYQVGKCYLIEVADFILNPAEGNTLADNWNNGAIPKHKYYKCEIVKLVGKMVCILGRGYDMSNQKDDIELWQGWLPQSGITILEPLN